jgi:hypothetical protein
MTFEDPLFWSTADLAQHFANQSYFESNVELMGDWTELHNDVGEGLLVLPPGANAPSGVPVLSERGVAAAAAGSVFLQALASAVKECSVVTANGYVHLGSHGSLRQGPLCSSFIVCTDRRSSDTGSCAHVANTGLSSRTNPFPAPCCVSTATTMATFDCKQRCGTWTPQRCSGR